MIFSFLSLSLSLSPHPLLLFFLSLSFCPFPFKLGGGVFNLHAIYSLLLIPEVFYIVMVKTVVGVPAGVFHSMFTVVNMERFELTPRTNGYLLTYIGIITAVSHVPVFRLYSMYMSASPLY